MSKNLFIPQQKLEGWVEETKVRFENNVLTLLSEELSYNLSPAVKVLNLIAGEDDLQLLGQIRTLADLEKLNVEHYRGSLIIGETAYECEDGFLGVFVSPPESVISSSSVSNTPSEIPVASSIQDALVQETHPNQNTEKSDTTQEDQNLLADFLLKHL